jgi:hypothetical protein
MDLHRMIAEIQEERHRLDEAIEALERLSAGKARRRGRPPGWLSERLERESSEAEAEEESEPNPPKNRKVPS